SGEVFPYSISLPIGFVALGIEATRRVFYLGFVIVSFGSDLGFFCYNLEVHCNCRTHVDKGVLSF
ncbi:hypothetical protein GIB67_000508, partial [Kingdonia uniflora]